MFALVRCLGRLWPWVLCSFFVVSSCSWVAGEGGECRWRVIRKLRARNIIVVLHASCVASSLLSTRFRTLAPLILDTRHLWELWVGALESPEAGEHEEPSRTGQRAFKYVLNAGLLNWEQRPNSSCGG